MFFRLAGAACPVVGSARTGRRGMAGQRTIGLVRRCGLVPLALWILAAGEVAAELKVLFIGNSFTYGYGSTTGVPDLFDRLARAGGQADPITLMRTVGGAKFKDHAGDSDTLAAINSKDWTHMVLQNHSAEPTHLTPNSGKSIADHLTFGRALYQQAMINHSHSKVVLYETWSRAASHPIITGTSTNTTFASTTQFQNEVRTNYRLLRDNLNNEFPDAPSVSVAPVGSAWELAGALLPLADPDFVDLFMANETPDYGYHANDRGTYLAACVFYAKLYGSSPVGLHLDPLISSLNLNFGSDPGMPAYLEAKAWEMVANGTNPVTIIGQPTAASVPEGHPVEFRAEVSGEPPFTIQWKMDGVPISGASDMVLRIPAAWTSINGAQFSVDISNGVSQVTSQPATLSVTTAAPYSVFLDFGGNSYPTTKAPSPNDPARHWNNILPAVGSTSDGRVAGLLTSQNVATQLDFEMLSRFNRENGDGATVTTVGLPQNATRDTLWGNTESTTGLTNVFPRFRIDGLAPSWRHTLTFFASRMDINNPSVNRQTIYTVTGAGSASVDLEVSNNTSNKAALSNVASAQEGNIEVALSPGPANNSSAHFTYLGSLQIDAQPGPAPPRAALVGTASGSGSIVASPAQADYAAGELIHLTAVPALGWVFAGWSGDAAGVANPVVVVIDADPAVTATFVPQNTAPTVSAITNQVINEDTSTGSMAFTIGDAETPVSLLGISRYSSNHALVAPSGLVLGGSGANRTIKVSPLPNAYGTTTITISVSDGELSGERSFLLTVTPQNDAPVANVDSGSANEGGNVLLSLAANDSDADDGLDLTSLAIVTGPANGSLVNHNDGTVTYSHNGTETTTDSFTYTIEDLAGAVSNSATVSLTVTPVNDGFGDWLAEFSISNSSPGADSDQGSISNAVEYVIGGDPVNRNDMDRLPGTILADPDGNTESPEYLLLSYRRTDRSDHDPLATIGVDWSSNLSVWNNAAAAPSVLTFVDDDHFGAGIDRVRVYLPLALSTSGRLFARLAVFIDYTK